MPRLPLQVDPAKTPVLPPPKGQISNFIDPSSLASVSESVGGLLLAIETVLVVLRTFSNVKQFGKLRFEDCICHPENLTLNLANMV